MANEVLMSHESFPPTEWPLVDAAGQGEAVSKQAALATLLCRYLPVLKVHLASQYRVPEDQASDWLQSFVLKKVLERDLIAQADRNRGKFRTFLLRSLHNFVIQQIRHEQAGKRSPAEPHVPIHDLQENEMAEIVTQTAESFDVAWARGVLAETIQRMERHCQVTDRKDVWGVFECRILKPLFEEAEPMEYEELVAQFGLHSPAQASNLLITAKRMFGRFLRSVIAEYAGTEEEIEAEIEELKAVLFRV
jgi:RNA polymerase sigma-70 factor (ECF subfamily)